MPQQEATKAHAKIAGDQPAHKFRLDIQEVKLPADKDDSTKPTKAH